MPTYKGKKYSCAQVELALAYGCADNLSNEQILEYIHQNRINNALRITYLPHARFVIYQFQKINWKKGRQYLKKTLACYNLINSNNDLTCSQSNPLFFAKAG